jgi:hypothetical protein
MSYKPGNRTKAKARTKGKANLARTKAKTKARTKGKGNLAKGKGNLAKGKGNPKGRPQEGALNMQETLVADSSQRLPRDRPRRRRLRRYGGSVYQLLLRPQALPVICLPT